MQARLDVMKTTEAFKLIMDRDNWTRGTGMNSEKLTHVPSGFSLYTSTHWSLFDEHFDYVWRPNGFTWFLLIPLVVWLDMKVPKSMLPNPEPDAK